MPTSVSTGAYIAALHKKLVQAERSLYEFRQIFEHCQCEIESTEITPAKEGSAAHIGPDGLYGGQYVLDPLHPDSAMDDEQECLD
jgi:hypothetical protein